jgi:CRISPR/Cas system Type II protein with McrA/HNH and RuvC-like nuclease domain
VATKRDRIIEKFGGKCQICGKQTNMKDWRDMPELDHIIPRKHGGSNKEENLSLLCSTCNNKKSDRHGTALLLKILNDSSAVLGQFDAAHLKYEYGNGTINKDDVMELHHSLNKEFARIISVLTKLDGD